jgi:hypothetical protein
MVGSAMDDYRPKQTRTADLGYWSEAFASSMKPAWGALRQRYVAKRTPSQFPRGHVSLHRLRAAQLRRMVRQSQLCDSGRFGVGQLHCECLDRSCDVLQFESAKFGKFKIKPAMQMVADRHTDTLPGRHSA